MLVDGSARERIRTELGTSFLVEASAGTGKTTEIVNRIVAVLAAGASVNRLIVVTFTNKAAGELKLRLRGALERARHRAVATQEKQSLEHALAHLEEARVSTIHSFCNDLLAERPVEARIDPSFVMVPEPEAQQLYKRAFQSWLESRMKNPSANLRRILRRTPRGESITDTLRHGGWSLVAWRDYDCPWLPRELDRGPAIARVLTEIDRLADLLRLNSTDTLAYSLRSVLALSDHVRRTETVRARDLDELEALLVSMADDRWLRKPRRGAGNLFAGKVTRAEVLRVFGEVCVALDEFRAAADADLAPRIQQELFDSIREYEALKAQLGVLDFDDLLLRARDLVRDDETVRRELQQRFSHIFVDEFQDTSSLQAELLLLLAADDPATSNWEKVRPAAGKLFVVGDPKQSIYRFRRADIRVYEAIKQQLSERGVPCLHLSRSFRSVPSVQRFVNEAFAPVMTGAAVHQPEYVPLMPVRDDEAGQPSVVVLAPPKPYGANEEIAKKAIRESLPDATAAFIEWLIERSGWTVEEEGRRVPVRAHHICLLFRKYAESFAGDLTRPYVSALEARDIPHLVVGGRSLHGREEVETLRAALASIEYPDDDLSLYATLRGALFAFPDTELFAYQRDHSFDYTRVPEEVAPELAPIREALLFLRSLHRERNARPVADTLTRLIEHTRSFANFVFRPSGEQVLANVLLVEEYARAYDMSGGVSFRGFVQQLERDAERSQAKEAPTLEEGATGVRMMTVHKAKGLEFPVVILADFCASRAETPREYFDGTRGLAAVMLAECAPRELLDNAALAQQEDAAEVARLAYVAATRARDLLVVSALGESPYEPGWLAPLSPALYPRPDQHRVTPPPPHCAGFGNETTLERPPISMAHSVRPGQYAFAGAHGAYDVAWWDPLALALEREPKFGVRQDTLLTHAAPADHIEQEVTAFREWEARHAETIASGSRPMLSVRRATEVARVVSEAEEPTGVIILEIPRTAVTILEIPRTAVRRPAGPRFGTLVHAIMAAVPLDASRETISMYASLCVRILAASVEDGSAAVDAVEVALAHPLLRRAAAAETRGQCRRETPVTLRSDSGEVIEGIVDLAFAEDGTWHVVDFKTDADLTAEQAVYEKQVTLYRDAIANATGCPCEGYLLRI